MLTAAVPLVRRILFLQSVRTMRGRKGRHRMKYLWVLGVTLLLVPAGVQAAAVQLEFGPAYAQIERILGPPDTAGTAWFQLHVGCGERIRAGQTIAVQRNVLGRIVLEYHAGTSDRVEMIARGNRTEPDNTILEIETFNNPDRCAAGDCPQVVAH